MLIVDRLELELRAAAVPARAATIERRMRSAMAGGLERALECRGCDDAGVELVFVDRLELTSCANTAWDDDRIVEEMAHRLDAAIAGLLRATAGRQTQEVLRFRDRSEWIAAYLLARVEGTAERRWWFEDFSGLRPLSLSAAIRTVVENEGVEGIEALLRLTPLELAKVVAALGTVDASRVLDVWLHRPSRARPDLPMLWAAAQRRDAGPPNDLVHACIETERVSQGAIGARTVTLVTAFAAIVRASATSRAITATLAPTFESLADWCAAAGIGADWIALLDAGEVAELVALMQERIASAPGAAPAGGRLDPGSTQTSMSERTPFGGMVVLAMVASWLDWPARWQRELEPASSRALLAAVCAHALSRRPRAILSDPGIVVAFGLGDARSFLTARARRTREALLAATGSTSLAVAGRTLLAAVAARVPGCNTATPAYLRRKLLASAAGIAIDDAEVRIALGRAPLHVLLLLAGLARGRFECGGRRFVYSTEEGA